MDMRNIQKMMKQMNTEELPAERVEIFLVGGKKLAIDKPSVVRMQVMGQTTFQVSGEVREEAGDPDADVQMVASATGKNAAAAQTALMECSGDIAAAILKLKD